MSPLSYRNLAHSSLIPRLLMFYLTRPLSLISQTAVPKHGASRRIHIRSSSQAPQVSLGADPGQALPCKWVDVHLTLSKTRPYVDYKLHRMCTPVLRPRMLQQTGRGTGPLLAQLPHVPHIKCSLPPRMVTNALQLRTGTRHPPTICSVLN